MSALSKQTVSLPRPLVSGSAQLRGEVCSLDLSVLLVLIMLTIKAVHESVGIWLWQKRWCHVNASNDEAASPTQDINHPSGPTSPTGTAAQDAWYMDLGS